MSNAKFYAYKLKVDEESTTTLFDAILDIVQNPRTRNNIVPHNIYKIGKKNQYIIACFYKNQMSNIPPALSSQTFKTNPLPLPNDQGLGHPTVFLYWPKLDMIFVETNRPGAGVTPKLLLEFLSMEIGVSKIDAEIVLNPKAKALFNKFTHISKFSVKVARAESSKVFSQRKNAVGEMIALADDSNSNQLNYEITSNRGAGLNISKVKGLVNELLRINTEEEVSHLIITGKEVDESGNIPVDLIQDRFQLTFSYAAERHISANSISLKFDELEELFLRNCALLESAYLPRK